MQVQKAKQGYKLVKSLFGKYEEIPEEWEVETLGKLCKIRKKGNTESDLYVGLEHIGQGNNTLEGRGDAKEFTSTKNVFQEGDILYGKLRPLLNKVWLAEESGFCSTDILPLIATDLIFNKLLLLILLHHNFYSHAVGTSAGTKMPRTNWSDMKKFLVMLPPLPEQQKIASVLSSVDSLVQQTRKIIEQTQRLKKGLMQKLLTKGIGHAKFKKVKSRYGKYEEIPEEWEVETLGKFIQIIAGDYFAFKDFTESGIRILKIDNVMYGYIDWEKQTFLPENYLESHKDLVLRNGDIVLALNRPITNNEMKVARLSEEDTPSILYQRVGKLQFSKDNSIDIDFVYVLFRSEIFKMCLGRILVGSDQPYVKTPELLKEKFALPGSKEEQQKIASVLSSVDSKIQKQQDYKSKLENLKKGLMQKLLTGQIRVKA